MQSQQDEAEVNLQGSVGLMKVLMATFGLAATFGTSWLAWIDDRRLRMTDDFAAISGTAILALLVTAFVEVNLHMRRAKSALAEYADVAEEEAGEWPRPLMHRDRDLGSYVQSLSAVTAAWSIITSLLVGDLVLVVLWACVDGHGPARWLAWFTFLSACYGFVFVTVVALLRVIFDGEDTLQTFWAIRKTQRRIWNEATQRRAAELQQRIVARQLDELARSLRSRGLPPYFANSRLIVHPPGTAEQLARALSDRVPLRPR